MNISTQKVVEKPKILTVKVSGFKPLFVTLKGDETADAIFSQEPGTVKLEPQERKRRQAGTPRKRKASAENQ